VKDNPTLRQDARAIFDAGLRAVDPSAAIKRYVRRDGANLFVADRRYDLTAYRRIFVVGGGKAGATMAQALEDLLGDRLTEGLVLVKYQHLAPVTKIRLHEAGHPVPDDAGVAGAKRLAVLLESATVDDLVVCVISGGGSALLPAPADGVTLEDKQAVTQQLLKCGATIHEMNAIRKHISALKGGQLARLAAPATLITLILSDVIGDSLDVIASGPTVPDTHTFDDCLKILRKYNLLDQTPAAVRARLQQGAAGLLAETPKAGDPIFAKTQHVIVASNVLAAQAAAATARALGYQTLILSTFVEGETRDVAKVHAAVAKEIRHTGNPASAPACVISGGETTVTIHGAGLGGRNQEFVLAAACEIADLEGVVVLSAGTDGTDGPTDAAGALADGQTVRRAKAAQLDPRLFLDANDSYHFFDALGDLIKTGPTNTNVMDLRIVLVA